MIKHLIKPTGQQALKYRGCGLSFKLNDAWALKVNYAFYKKVGSSVIPESN